MRNVEFWIVTFEENGKREVYRRALTAEVAKSMARELAIAGKRGRTRRFVVAVDDVWKAIDHRNYRFIA